ncbi:MAG: hypothetical protein PHE24_02380 [Patescibacteria group bacterium]|nr:hypothetical protein [Patescibacteria group bacterium]
MFKLLAGIVFAACAIANANNTIYLSPKKALPFNNDSIMWIVSLDTIPKAFQNGELLVDIANGTKVITIHDTTFRLLASATGGTDVIIDLYRLVAEYSNEASKRLGTQNNGKITPAEAANFKKTASNWRLHLPKKK